jgi:hypothetical protein
MKTSSFLKLATAPRANPNFQGSVAKTVDTPFQPLDVSKPPDSMTDSAKTVQPAQPSQTSATTGKMTTGLSQAQPQQVSSSPVQTSQTMQSSTAVPATTNAVSGSFSNPAPKQIKLPEPPKVDVKPVTPAVTPGLAKTELPGQTAKITSNVLTKSNPASVVSQTAKPGDGAYTFGPPGGKGVKGPGGENAVYGARAGGWDGSISPMQPVLPATGGAPKPKELQASPANFESAARASTPEVRQQQQSWLSMTPAERTSARLAAIGSRQPISTKSPVTATPAASSTFGGYAIPGGYRAPTPVTEAATPAAPVATQAALGRLGGSSGANIAMGAFAPGTISRFNSSTNAVPVGFGSGVSSAPTISSRTDFRGSPEQARADIVARLVAGGRYTQEQAEAAAPGMLGFALRTGNIGGTRRAEGGQPISFGADPTSNSDYERHRRDVAPDSGYSNRRNQWDPVRAQELYQQRGNRQAAIDSAQQRVTQLQQQLAGAKTDSDKKAIQAQLDTAIASANTARDTASSATAEQTALNAARVRSPMPAVDSTRPAQPVSERTANLRTTRGQIAQTNSALADINRDISAITSRRGADGSLSAADNNLLQDLRARQSALNQELASSNERLEQARTPAVVTEPPPATPAESYAPSFLDYGDPTASIQRSTWDRWANYRPSWLTGRQSVAPTTDHRGVPTDRSSYDALWNLRGY